MEYFLVVIKFWTVKNSKKVPVTYKKEFIIDNMETAVELYANFMEQARDYVRSRNSSATVALFRPTITEKGFVTETPKNKEYILIDNIDAE